MSGRRLRAQAVFRSCLAHRLALGVALFLTTAETPPAPPATAPADFCARLATDSGIDRTPAKDGHTNWTISALSFGQRFVYGGSVATGIGVRPINPDTVADYQRLEDMCMPVGKGAVCKLVGPVNFEFIWKARKIMTPVRAGERATVSVIGSKTTCRTEAP